MYQITFYSAVIFVTLIIIDIIYVSYSFKIENFYVIWPLHVLRSVCSLVITILFLPVLDIFTYMLSCVRDSNGVLRHQEFTEIECFKGNHILNAIFSVILTITFISICMIVGITFFECKTDSSDPSTRWVICLIFVKCIGKMLVLTSCISGMRWGVSWFLLSFLERNTSI